MTKTHPTKKQLEDLSGGLFLMTIFTTIWVIIAEANLMGRDQWATTGVFGVIILYFIINYNKLTKAARSISNEPPIDDEAEKARDKRFYYILAIEGIAIFIMKNVLLNTGHNNLFFPFFALIVGLHFFPMAKLYNRTFYYILGIWMCLMAAAGFVLTYQPNVPAFVPAAVIGIGCALATTINGIRILRQGDMLLEG
jgi:hypothetical protein